ncbi:hypothetical protein ACH5RR_008188 [Cinchona calisaya]|uniref:Uncharacterized protein n=1 Tax=Cinchona calisaya TaxID=153742 RepID=A0ABD3AD77_9GENT
MAVSAGTIILLDLCLEKYFPSSQLAKTQDSHQGKQILKSCLSSSGGKKGEKSKKKKKRVKFAEDVKEPSGNGEEYRREHSMKKKSNRIQTVSCALMPANRVALYSGILKDRLQRTEFSY